MKSDTWDKLDDFHICIFFSQHAPLEDRNVISLKVTLSSEVFLLLLTRCTHFLTVVAVWPGSIPPWLFWHVWRHEEEQPGCLWHRTPSSPPNERSRILWDKKTSQEFLVQLYIYSYILFIYMLPCLPDPSSPIMWPQPPQPICEPSGLTNLQLEPVPDIKTTPPAEITGLNNCVDFTYYQCVDLMKLNLMMPCYSISQRWFQLCPWLSFK